MAKRKEKTKATTSLGQKTQYRIADAVTSVLMFVIGFFIGLAFAALRQNMLQIQDDLGPLQEHRRGAWLDSAN